MVKQKFLFLSGLLLHMKTVRQISQQLNCIGRFGLSEHKKLTTFQAAIDSTAEDTPRFFEAQIGFNVDRLLLLHKMNKSKCI